MTRKKIQTSGPAAPRAPWSCTPPSHPAAKRTHILKTSRNWRWVVPNPRRGTHGDGLEDSRDAGLGGLPLDEEQEVGDAHDLVVEEPRQDLVQPRGGARLHAHLRYKGKRFSTRWRRRPARGGFGVRRERGGTLGWCGASKGKDQPRR
jgi:hypothetical protein